MKAFVDLDSGITRGEIPDDKDTLKSKNKRLESETKNQRRRLRSKNRKINQLKEELRVMEEQTKMGESKDQEISLPKDASLAAEHAARRRRNRRNKFQAFQLKGGLETGALPDFAIIGTQKGGTSSLYRLLTQHPHVERAALKEIHYFDGNLDKGIEWYRQCFPLPRWKDGRRTITGEATPGYLFHPSAPERMAKVVPEARLIALLRNPVDRAYSGYHHAARYGRETRSFEEAIEAEEKWLLSKGREEEDPDNEQHLADSIARPYLSRGIYVDQLMRWSKYFNDEQMLVLKSEDFFEHTPEKLKVVLDFLGLPEWEPEAWEVRNQGSYKEMDVSTRRRLEALFEPHNQKLYDYLGVDFGW